MRYFLFSLCLFVTRALNGQSLDSINQVILEHLNKGNPRELQKSLTVGIDLAQKNNNNDLYTRFIYYTGTSYYNIDLDSGLYFLNRSYTLADSLNNDINRMLSASQLSAFYREKGNYSEALKYLNISHQILLNQEEGERKHRALLSNYSKFGKLFNAIGDYEKSMDYFIKALAKAREFDDYTSIAIRLTDIGLLNKQIGDYELALSNFFEAMQMSIETSNPSLESKSLANIANIYFLKSDFDSSIYFLNKSINIKDSIDISANETRLSLAEVYFELADYENLSNEFLKIDTTGVDFYATSFGVKYLIFDAKVSLKRNFIEDSYKKASKAYSNAISIGSLIQLSEVTKLLASITEEMKKNENSIEYLKLHQYYKDSLLNIDRLESIEKLKAIYEKNKQQEEIIKLEQAAKLVQIENSRRSTILIASIIVLILIASVGIIWVQRKLAIEKANALDANQKFLRSRINPHFLFNALTSIRSYLYEEKNTKLVVGYISNFASLMRKFLEHSGIEHISIHEELEALKSYVELQQLRYNNDFSLKINLDESIADEEVMIPTLLLQPYIENAIEHGVSNQDNGSIIIEIQKIKNNLQIRVLDNGTRLVQSNRLSHSGIIQKRRMSYFNNGKSRAYELTQQELKDDCGNKIGYEVKILLPIIVAL